MKDLILEILEDGSRYTARKLVDELKGCSHRLTQGEINQILSELQKDGLVRKVGASWKLADVKALEKIIPVTAEPEKVSQVQSVLVPEVVEEIIEEEPFPVYYADPGIISLLLSDVDGNNQLLQKSKLAPLFMGLLQLVAQEKGEEVTSLLNNLCWYATPLALEPMDYRGVSSLTNTDGEIVYELRKDFLVNPQSYFEKLLDVKPHCEQDLLNQLLNGSWVHAVVERVNGNEFTSVTVDQLKEHCFEVYGYKEEEVLEEISEVEEKKHFADSKACELLLSDTKGQTQLLQKAKLGPILIKLLENVAAENGEMLLSYVKYLKLFAPPLFLVNVDYDSASSLTNEEGFLQYEVREDFIENEAIYFLSLQGIQPKCDFDSLNSFLSGDWLKYVFQQISLKESLKLDLVSFKEECLEYFGYKLKEEDEVEVVKVYSDFQAYKLMLELTEANKTILGKPSLAPLFMALLNLIASEKGESLLAYEHYLKRFALPLILKEPTADAVDESGAVIAAVRDDYLNNSALYFLSLQTISPNLDQKSLTNLINSDWLQYVLNNINDEEGLSIESQELNESCCDIYGFNDQVERAEPEVNTLELEAKVNKLIKDAEKSKKLALNQSRKPQEQKSTKKKIPAPGVDEDLIQSVLKGSFNKDKTQTEEGLVSGRHDTFPDGAKNISYEKLFAPYLKGAKAIELIDPYIRTIRQVRNLRELLLMIKNKVPNSKGVYFKLKTKSNPGEEDFLKRQLELLRSDFRGEISFDFELSSNRSLHARTLETNQGWKIILDRGIDIFHSTEIPASQENRPCRSFYVTYIKDK